MDTPQSRARPPQLLSKPNPPSSSPPPPRPISFSSATTSPSHDDFSFPSPFGGHLLPLPMSRTPVGRVGSDLSHLSRHARASHHHATTSNGITTSTKDRDRDSSRAKNKASPFFSGLGSVWRKESSSSSSDVVTGKQRQAEEKRKDRAARRALDDVGQWVKRHMASMVEQLRASFSRHQSERERREHQRRRPHSFSGHGPGAVREMRGPGQEWDVDPSRPRTWIWVGEPVTWFAAPTPNPVTMVHPQSESSSSSHTLHNPNQGGRNWGDAGDERRWTWRRKAGEAADAGSCRRRGSELFCAHHIPSLPGSRYCPWKLLYILLSLVTSQWNTRKAGLEAADVATVNCRFGHSVVGSTTSHTKEGSHGARLLICSEDPWLPS